MKAPTLGAGQGLERHLADQDVAEGEDIGPRGTKEILVHQPVDHLVQSLEGRFQREEARWSKRSSEHRAQLNDPPLLRGEQVESSQHRGLDRIR